MSVAAQIQLFSKAKLVLGPHGAGLTNIVWTPNGYFCSSYIQKLNELIIEN